MTIRQSFTAVVERNLTWTGAFTSEPYEAGWASEAICFVRVLKVEGDIENINANIQISPDGMNWCDEGTHIALPSQTDEVTFGRVAHFGSWLRIAGVLPSGTSLTVIVYWSLKE